MLDEFDEKDYFEFYPLHVVKKLKRKRRKRVKYRDGSDAFVPNEDHLIIVNSDTKAIKKKVETKLKKK